MRLADKQFILQQIYDGCERCLIAPENPFTLDNPDLIAANGSLLFAVYLLTAEHKLHINKGFSYKYNTDKLVYYEVYDLLDAGIRRDKQLKKWRREWKEKLINDFNPEWRDLSEDIGVNAEYIQAVKNAYDNGQYVEGNRGFSYQP